MSETKQMNIPQLSVGDAVKNLVNAYSAVINAGKPVSLLPSVMLWGPPGIGKSQAVREIAGNIEKTTSKKVCVTDVRLLLFNPIDLRGIPTANADKTLAVWLKPKIFQMDESPDIVNILFLDEISAAPQSVQAAAYQITLDRTVGEHRLPENCIVIAAGNRVTDKSVAYKMPKALANRLLHFEIEGSFDSWKEWAVKAGINDKVIGFLSFSQSRLMGFDASGDDLAFPTPRTWEMVSNVLENVCDDPETVFPLISGLIGMGAAAEFVTWCGVYRELPDMEDIFNGKSCKVPKGTDALYALEASMATYAREHGEDINGIANSLRYADSFPPDFMAILIKDYLGLEKGIMEKLLKMPEFSRKLGKVGRLLNAAQ